MVIPASRRQYSIASIERNTAARFLINLERQLKADSTVGRGQDHVTTVHADPQHFVQIGVSVHEVRTDLGDLGVLWLDPAPISLTPLLPVNSSRRAEFRIHVPMDPSLRRMRFYFQAIDLDCLVVKCVLRMSTKSRSMA